MKIDFKKELKQLYYPSSKEATIVNVPSMTFLMVDGEGDPNTSQEYKNAIESLYALSYKLKFMIKKEMAVDYVVMPLEGLWWTDDMTQFTTNNKDVWKWSAMIMQPKYVTKDLFTAALEQVKKKKHLFSLSKMRFESFHEGLAAQITHIGPFSAEGPTIERLHRFIKDNGYVFDGLKQKHHEIYLGDPRRQSEKMKTVIRQPMEKKPN